MRIFITGGSGFIGLPTAKLLARKGHRLLLLSRNPEELKKKISGANISFAKGDLTNILSWAGKLKRFKPEEALHLAWEGIPDYSAAMSAKNLKYGRELFNLLEKVGVNKIVAAGSSWEYGREHGRLSEKMSPSPKLTGHIRSVGHFIAAKNAIHAFGKRAMNGDDRRFLWARLFFVYGPGQREGALMPYLIRSKAEGKKPEIKNPHGANDFIYVDDAARALVLLLLKRAPDRFSIYNIGSGALTKVRDVFNLVYGNKKSAGVGGRGFYADISKIKKEIGWRPTVAIGEGIKKMIDYYKKS